MFGKNHSVYLTASKSTESCFLQICFSIEISAKQVEYAAQQWKMKLKLRMIRICENLTLRPEKHKFMDLWRGS